MIGVYWLLGWASGGHEWKTHSQGDACSPRSFYRVSSAIRLPVKWRKVASRSVGRIHGKCEPLCMRDHAGRRIGGHSSKAQSCHGEHAD